MAYATRAQFYALGVPESALSATTTEQDTALEAASGVVDTYLRPRYGAPFPSPYPPELTRAVCHIAAWDLMVAQGVSPDGKDAYLETRHDNAITWLKDVARGIAHLDHTADATPSEEENVPLIDSDDVVDWDA